MTKLEILSEIKTKKLAIAEILDKIATDKRELTNVEKITVDSLNDEIKEFEQRAKNLNEKPQTVVKIGEGVDSSKFSISRYLRNIAEGGNFSEIENEIVKQGRESFRNAGFSYKGFPLPFTFEQRTLTAGTSGAGSELVPEDKFNLLMPLRAKNVLAKAGATILSGLVGNISIPVMTGSTAAWKGEVVAAANGGNGFTEVEFSPKKLTVYLPVSKLLLIQNSVQADQKLQQDLINAINEKLESTLLGTSSGSSTQPAGLFYGASYTNGGVAVTGSTSWDKVVALETGVNTNNADSNNMVYLIHPTTLGKMKTTAKASNTAVFIAENATINGYKFYTTTNLPTISTGKGVAFGDFSNLYINFWNNMEIVVDPYTSAKEGIVNYIVTLYTDGGNTRDKAIAKGWLS